MERSAVISECGLYRYRLDRRWDEALPSLPFLMLNPSTADALIDDPTIRRCIGFAKRDGFGGIKVVNRFAFRATRPEALKTVADPFGPLNEGYLANVAIASQMLGTPVVCAWGSNSPFGATAVIALMRKHGAHLSCLGRTKGGHPKHPLYISGAQPLEPFA